MIKNFSDLKFYINEDASFCSISKKTRAILVDDVFRFQVVLRLLEYMVNTKKPHILIGMLKIYFRYLSKKLGFTIPINVFGYGLSIAHYGTIVINGAARVGCYCRIHTCVNIGTDKGYKNRAPKIGDNCYIGPGAKIFGDIEIGNNINIGANSVVNKDFKLNNATLVGVPAKVIRNMDS